ncbi:hypothetical protein GGI17_004890 [Coemansia sp. S146]|nr:hypothetical protein GGI17_004890 [Coemansia sp. S146]
MSTSPSLFQSLPMLVVYKVIEYLEGRTRTSFSLDMVDHNEAKRVLTPLLSVGERWRTAALESICDNCELTFSHSRRAVEVKIPAWPADFSCPQLCKSSLVKLLVVSAALWRDMCDGAFCEALSTIQYETMSFPSANKLVVYLDKTTKEESDGSAATSQEKVVDFARSLLRLVPAVTNVIVNFSYVSDRVPEYARLYDTLVSELYQGGVTSLEVYSELDGPPLSLSLGDTLGLTSITHEPKTAIEEAEPFPALSTLALVDGYPFDDDLLFRVPKRSGLTQMQSVRVSGILDEDDADNFRVLRIPHATEVPAEEIAYAAMLLAVLCPNLVQVDLPPGMRNVFGREIAWASYNDPFKPYSESINRLIYKEVE